MPSPAPPSDEPSNAAPFDCAQGGRKVLCDATKELCWRSALPDCRASQHESCETVVKAYRQVCPSKTATCTGTRAAGFTVECGP